MGAKDAYDQSLEKLKMTNPSANNIFDVYLAEKSLDITRVSYFSPNYLNHLTYHSLSTARASCLQ
jgi:hypothetical protein